MKTTKTGKIIIVSSAWGKMASPYAEIYCSAKFAIEGYFEGLAAALRSFNIRVCLVEPGKVNTGFVDPFHVGLVSGAQDDTVDDIDRRQLRYLNDHVKAAPGVTPDAVAEAITTRCLDVDEPVFRHLLPVEVLDEVPTAAADITGETVIGILRKSIEN
ncbi:estradiol 17-beta-dehydrogenase 1-like [Strongylocentrotus purpuratus]|uniref:Uncharacterized protein n=1 Tax=Strongylocentrotus purpuratus TaxID=7668 RepID=A0A7M7HQF6_STRPU|nr:estradiol 17-beta-dehydrogenase 1-like [Strongylocentrotus purpuratus]|eukprot:XP_011678507.1 PREDICTED: estradiol 17-beta-dehydrogenase 1-like [Strongylocentrotus purpuratus]